MKQKKFSTYDVNLAAWFIYNGHIPALEKLRPNTNKVAFLFPIEPSLYEALDQYNRNAAVPVLDFVACLKATRGRMISKRQEEQSE
jgi:hypothetical protein